MRSANRARGLPRGMRFAKRKGLSFVSHNVLQRTYAETLSILFPSIGTAKLKKSGQGGTKKRKAYPRAQEWSILFSAHPLDPKTCLQIRVWQYIDCVILATKLHQCTASAVDKYWNMHVQRVGKVSERISWTEVVTTAGVA